MPANIFSAKIKKKFFSKTKIKFSVKNSRGTLLFILKAAFCLRLSSNDGDNQNIIINEFGNIQSVKAPLEVLLVSGRRDGSAENYWVLPGGGVELKVFF